MVSSKKPMPRTLPRQQTPKEIFVYAKITRHILRIKKTQINNVKINQTYELKIKQ